MPGGSGPYLWCGIRTLCAWLSWRQERADSASEKNHWYNLLLEDMRWYLCSCSKAGLNKEDHCLVSPNLVSLFFHLFFFPFSTCSHSLPAPIPTFSTSAFSSFSFPISYFSSGLSSVHLTPSHNACNSAQVSWTPRTVCVHCTIASPNQAWESSRRVYWCHSRDVKVTLPEHIYVAGTFKHLDKLLLILLPRTR